MKKLLFLLLLTACTPGGHFAIHEENDYFSGRKTDRFYTQGAKFTYLFPARPDATVDSISVGNNIYNPEDKHIAGSILWERPYAGYSYVEGARRLRISENVQRTLSFQAGLIGPGSGGKFFQCSVHKLLDQRCPDGWANQLKDELTVLLIAEQRRKTPLQTFNIINFDAIGNYGGELGNVSTLGRAGGIIRLGLFRGDDFGPSLIFPRIDRFSEEKRWQFYLFTGLEGRFVARNIFLDGNTFEESARVTKEPFVADLKWGAMLSYNEIKLTYSWVHITSEYIDSKSTSDFGSIDISWGW